VVGDARRAAEAAVRTHAALALALAALAAGCARADAVAVAGERPSRIVCVGGAVCEAALALGAGDRLIARDRSSTFPEAVTRLPEIGYQRTLTAEPILALSPDLVVASFEAGPPATIAQLRAAGLRVALMSSAMSPETAADRVAAVGAAIGERAAGERMARALADDARTASERARARLASGGGPPPRVLFVYARGAGAAMVSGRGTAADAMLELVGAANAITAFDGFRPLSPEVLIASAPDVVLVPAGGLDALGGEAALLALPGMAETPAGRARRIVALDDLLLLGFGPRLPAALDALAAGLGG
jgi:iron complex transport system substrate-binding protein